MKGELKQVSQHTDQHAKIIFFVRKKDGGYSPVIDPKTLNQFVLYMHFKMESSQT